MDTNTELQPIVKEYFEKQKESSLKLCIYEEKASKDIEWFYDDVTEEWCYLKTKKERFDGQYDEVINIERKRFKTFGKKCHVTEMSFFNFMAIRKLKAYNADSELVSGIWNYINEYKSHKKDNPNFSLDDFDNLIKDRRNKGGCLLSLLGFIGTFAVLIANKLGSIT